MLVLMFETKGLNMILVTMAMLLMILRKIAV